MIEIDHDTREVMVEQMSSDIGDIVAIPPPLGTVRARLAAPVITNNIEMEKISFERNKSGIWGWRSEKSEVINGYNCKVYGASNVEFVTKTRMDHLNEEQIKVNSSKSTNNKKLILTVLFCRTKRLARLCTVCWVLPTRITCHQRMSLQSKNA